MPSLRPFVTIRSQPLSTVPPGPSLARPVRPVVGYRAPFSVPNSSCPRKVFCERLPQVARVYGRQTDRASEIIRLIGYVAGGLPGQRLLARLSIATSDDTVLRRIRDKPGLTPTAVPVRNLGVDDWAWRKGQDYGTIQTSRQLEIVAAVTPLRRLRVSRSSPRSSSRTTEILRLADHRPRPTRACDSGASPVARAPCEAAESIFFPCDMYTLPFPNYCPRKSWGGGRADSTCDSVARVRSRLSFIRW